MTVTRCPFLGITPFAASAGGQGSSGGRSRARALGGALGCSRADHSIRPRAGVNRQGERLLDYPHRPPARAGSARIRLASSRRASRARPAVRVARSCRADAPGPGLLQALSSISRLLGTGSVPGGAGPSPVRDRAATSGATRDHDGTTDSQNRAGTDGHHRGNGQANSYSGWRQARPCGHRKDDKIAAVNRKVHGSSPCSGASFRVRNRRRGPPSDFRWPSIASGYPKFSSDARRDIIGRRPCGFFLGPTTVNFSTFQAACVNAVV
jgi:hypothetical protein